MAEIIGCVSGAIAIAQVVASISQVMVNLNHQWMMVKDIPADIIDLKNQIECHYPTLIGVESILGKEALPNPHHELILKRAVTNCHKALDDLNGVAQKLGNAISKARNKQTLVYLKVLLRKPLLQKLEGRLECAVRILTLAQQTYLLYYMFRP